MNHIGLPEQVKILLELSNFMLETKLLSADLAGFC